MKKLNTRSSTSRKLPARAANFCPFLQNPGPDCYCMHMESEQIHRILRYCAGDFERCRHFRNNLAVPGGDHDTL